MILQQFDVEQFVHALFVDQIEGEQEQTLS